MTPERRAQLEEEREFLLRSLEDLERERAAGDVDEADYLSLQDGYTARAAAVLRELGEEPAAPAAAPAGRRRSWPVVAAWTALVLVVAVVAGVLVSRSTGERLPGQVASGNPQDDSVSSLLTRARMQLNPQDPGPASELYARVLDMEPENVEALTYLGWLSVLASAQETDQESATQRFQSGALLLRQATTIDDTYPDAHCLLGVVFYRFAGDPAAAEPEFQRCLDLNPPAEMRQLVEPVLADLQSASTTTTVP